MELNSRLDLGRLEDVNIIFLVERENDGFVLSSISPPATARSGHVGQ